MRNHHVNEFSICQTSIPAKSYLDKLFKQQHKGLFVCRKQRRRNKHGHSIVLMLDTAIVNELLIMHKLRNNKFFNAITF